MIRSFGTRSLIRSLGAAVIFGVILGVLALGAPVAARQAARSYPGTECFPFEALPAELRARAETLLLKALDGEALYTIASDLKPMSSGIVSVQVDVDKPDLAEVEALRTILAAWTCGGELQAGLQAFAAVYDNKRPLEALVFNVPRLRQMVRARESFFGRFGISPAASPIEVAMSVEHAQPSARFRGYGYLFGFPDHAIDFFVSAAESEKATGTFVVRDFVSLPTVLGERHFVYAVPKGHQPNDADMALRAAAEPIYRDYQARRERHIKGPDARGVLALVREWFDDGRGDVRPSNARKPAAVTR